MDVAYLCKVKMLREKPWPWLEVSVYSSDALTPQLSGLQLLTAAESIPSVEQSCWGEACNTRSFASRKNRQQETSLEDLLNSPLNVGGFLFKLACSCLVLYVLNVLQTTVFLCSLSCSCAYKECSWHALGINGFDCGPRLKVFPASPRLQGPFWAEWNRNSGIVTKWNYLW